MFLKMLKDRLYQESTGFLNAGMDVRILRVAMMTALVMEMVCCSMALWRMIHVITDILS